MTVTTFKYCEKSCLISPQNSNKTRTRFVKTQLVCILHFIEYNFVFWIVKNVLIRFVNAKFVISASAMPVSTVSISVKVFIWWITFSYKVFFFFFFHRKLLYRYLFKTTRKLTYHISLQCSLNISSFPLYT